MDRHLKLRLEKTLARAHETVWMAASWCESSVDQGIADDLYEIAAEIGRVHLSVVDPKKPRRKSVDTRTYL
jgi:hypothetical protein